MSGHMKANLSTGRRTVLGNSHGQMGLTLKEDTETTKSKEKGNCTIKKALLSNKAFGKRTNLLIDLRIIF